MVAAQCICSASTPASVMSVTPFHWVADPGNTKGSPLLAAEAAWTASVWPMFIALPTA